MRRRQLSQIKRRAQNRVLTAGDALNPNRVISHDHILPLARFNGTRWCYPWSVLLREDLREPLRNRFPSDLEYRETSERFEARMALFEWLTPGSGWRTSYAEFCGEQAMRADDPWWAAELRKAADGAPPDWAWSGLAGGFDRVSNKLDDFVRELKDRAPRY